VLPRLGLSTASRVCDSCFFDPAAFTSALSPDAAPVAEAPDIASHGAHTMRSAYLNVSAAAANVSAHSKDSVSKIDGASSSLAHAPTFSQPTVAAAATAITAEVEEGIGTDAAVPMHGILLPIPSH